MNEETVALVLSLWQCGSCGSTDTAVDSVRGQPVPVLLHPASCPVYRGRVSGTDDLWRAIGAAEELGAAVADYQSVPWCWHRYKVST